MALSSIVAVRHRNDTPVLPEGGFADRTLLAQREPPKKSESWADLTTAPCKAAPRHATLPPHYGEDSKLNKSLTALAACSVLLSACGSVPPLNFTPANIGVVQKQQPVQLVSTIVTIARPDEAAGPIEVAGMENELQQLWKTALEDAVTRMAIFDDDASTRVNMNVKLLKLDVPAFGASMTTQTVARYEILDRNSGAVIYTTDVQTDGVVPMDYNFVGVIRARESASRSVQNNIATFLQRLETADLSRAQFPSPR